MGQGEAEEKAHLSTETGQRLVSRMSQVGGQQWSREEERARVEREAAWMATIHGREVVRKGRFWAS